METLIGNNLALAWALAAAAGILALLLGGYLLITLRRYRRDQKVIMGEGREKDLVAHARALQQRMDGLAYDLRRLAGDIDGTNRRVDDCLTFRSVIRYDAYRDLSGMQSTSMALLDAQFSGIIVSAIQSREDARIFVKEIRHGESREKLAPEEIQVLKEAMGLKNRETPRRAAGGDTSA